MITHIVRLEKSTQGFIGVFLFEGVIFCFTLERDDTFLKPGSYHCQKFHGTKWPNTYEILVKGHTDVLFHSGNVEGDTKGCVLLGATTGKLKGDRAIGVPIQGGDKFNSGYTFKKFLETLGDTPFFTLYVTNNFC